MYHRRGHSAGLCSSLACAGRWLWVLCKSWPVMEKMNNKNAVKTCLTWPLRRYHCVMKFRNSVHVTDHFEVYGGQPVVALVARHVAPGEILYTALQSLLVTLVAS